MIFCDAFVFITTFYDYVMLCREYIILGIHIGGRYQDNYFLGIFNLSGIALSAINLPPIIDISVTVIHFFVIAPGCGITACDE